MAKVRKIGTPILPDTGEMGSRIPRMGAASALASNSPNPGSNRKERGTMGATRPTSRTANLRDRRYEDAGVYPGSAERYEAMSRNPSRVVRDPHALDSFGAGSKTGLGAHSGIGGQGNRVDMSDTPEGLINQTVMRYLAAQGQTPGPQYPGMDEIQAMKFLRDQGLMPLGGFQEPTARTRMGQEGPGGGGAGQETPGEAVAGQNPIAPFLAQILNPRMSPTSRTGEVPTLPGAPQGFSLYNMLRLVQMFKQLYGGLPVGGQSLPAGVGGAGGPALTGGY